MAAIKGWQLAAISCLLAATACASAIAAVPAASAGTSDTPPSGGAAQAIAWVNANVRRPLSLPDLTWDAKTAQAAAAHANYLLLNPSPFGHEEAVGKPGFTGVEPEDRCQAAGAAYCGEVAYPQLQLPAAVAGWLETP